MQHDSATFNSKFLYKRTHQPTDRISSLRQTLAYSPFLGTSFRSFLSRVLLKLIRFVFFFFLVREEILLSEVWCNFVMLGVVVGGVVHCLSNLEYYIIVF